MSKNNNFKIRDFLNNNPKYLKISINYVPYFDYTIKNPFDELSNNDFILNKNISSVTINVMKSDYYTMSIITEYDV